MTYFGLQTVVVCLFCHMSAAFDTTDHSILITRLRATLGCSGTVLDWFISYLRCHTQSMFVDHESTPSVLKCGVPRGSVLELLLITLYTHPLSTIICHSGLSYHFCANDSQLHISSVPSDFPVLACCLKDCIEGAAEWMSDGKFKIIIIIITFCPYWSIDHLQELSRHPDPGPASQVVPRYNKTSLCQPQGRDAMCFLGGLAFSFPAGSRSGLTCDTGHWLSEGVSNLSSASLGIPSSAGCCLVRFQSSLLLMVSGHRIRRILLKQVLKDG